jgi:hypothetical protein
MSSKARRLSNQSDDIDSTQLWSVRERLSKKRARKSACLGITCAAGVILAIAVVVGVSIGVLVVRNTSNRLPSEPYERALALLDSSPLIDG